MKGKTDIRECLFHWLLQFNRPVAGVQAVSVRLLRLTIVIHFDFMLRRATGRSRKEGILRETTTA